MKKILQMILGLLIFLSLAGCSDKTPMRDGEFQGSGEGKNGPVTISMTIKDGKAVSAKVISEAETEGLGKPAIDYVLQKYIETQDIGDIDVVSGATFSSEATFDAIEDAIRASKGIQDKKKVYKDTECDIVVIGSGSAGLSAATEAASKGLSVIVLEKMGISG